MRTPVIFKHSLAPRLKVAQRTPARKTIFGYKGGAARMPVRSRTSATDAPIYLLQINELDLVFNSGQEAFREQTRHFFMASKTVLRRRANDPAMFTDL
jgi:hypothetical protein